MKGHYINTWNPTTAFSYFWLEYGIELSSKGSVNSTNRPSRLIIKLITCILGGASKSIAPNHSDKASTHVSYSDYTAPKP